MIMTDLVRTNKEKKKNTFVNKIKLLQKPSYDLNY